MGWCDRRPLVLDLHQDDSPVWTVDDVSTGLQGAVLQAANSAAFRELLQAGAFVVAR